MAWLEFRSCWRPLLVAGLFSAEAAAGQSLEIATLEKTALEGSPVLAEARARLRAALALVDAAEAPGDPALEVWGRNVAPGLTDRKDDRTALEVEVVQPVRFPGKREAARALAESEVAVARAELAATEAETIAELRAAFAGLVAADREQRSLADAHELLELLIATARSRFGTAQDGALAVLEAELALDEHDLTLDRIFADFLSQRARVAALAGLEPQSVPLLVGALPTPAFQLVEGPLPVSPEAPKIALARARVEAAERRVDAAKLDLRPDFGLGGGLMWPEGDSVALTAKVGMDLPFFRRRRYEPRLRAAEAGLDGARAALAAEGFSSRSEAARLGAERDRIERALKRLGGAVIPRTSVALDAARIAFLNGELPFSRLLELQNDWFHARVELATAEAELYRIWAESQQLLAPAVAMAPSSPEIPVPPASPDPPPSPAASPEVKP